MVNFARKFKESEKRNKHLNLARERKNTMKHEGNGDTNCIGRLEKIPNGLKKVLKT